MTAKLSAHQASSGSALRMFGVSKTFGETRVLADLALNIPKGEIHALVGQNGSGKSTLVKILSGFHKPDAGARAFVANRALGFGSADASRQAGLRFVHQTLGLIDTLSVADNFNLSVHRRRIAPIRRRVESNAAAEALAQLGYDHISPQSRVLDLVPSERTAVALARALHRVEGVHLLVLDEPTASLPGLDAQRLFSAMRGIAARGTSILFISHHIEEIVELSDNVTVLRNGRVVAEDRTANLTHNAIIEHMLGRRLLDDSTSHESRLDSRAADRTGLAIRSLRGRVVRDLSVDVPAGSVLGIAGLVGSGREEVASLLAGRLPRGGSVYVDGTDVPPGEPAAAISAGICTVHADRAAHGVLPGGSVRENLTIGDLASISKLGYLNKRAEREATRDWISRLDVRPRESEKLVTELSGGNQQKIILGRWLRRSPKVLVLDEPTQGVDVGATVDIHQWVDAACAGGRVVVICSTDAAELARLSSEVLVLHGGVVSARLSGPAITAERIEQEQLTATIPRAVGPTGAAPNGLRR